MGEVPRRGGERECPLHHVLVDASAPAGFYTIIRQRGEIPRCLVCLIRLVAVPESKPVTGHQQAIEGGVSLLVREQRSEALIHHQSLQAQLQMLLIRQHRKAIADVAC